MSLNNLHISRNGNSQRRQVVTIVDCTDHSRRIIHVEACDRVAHGIRCDQISVPASPHGVQRIRATLN